MLSLEMVRTDVLVIGAGLAGLRAAVAASEHGRKVIVVSKGPRCTAGVMAFNAAVEKEDSTHLYYQDIIDSGKGLSDAKLAVKLAENSVRELHYLEELGLSFDREEGGEYALLQPLGCSRPRCVHIGRFTGPESERVFLQLLKERRVSVSYDTNVLELLSDGESVFGALTLKGEDLVVYSADSVVLAAGGCGALYPVSTYPQGIWGDSYGMLARAGGMLTDMEFMQFEPCCLAEPEHLKGKGISTTMMQAGGKLLNADGEEFLEKYIPTGTAIQKGDLSRAMFEEMESCGGRPIQFDLRALSAEELEMHCLWGKQLKAAGWDLSADPLKVCPAAHTFLGGAKVDENCETSLKGLFAAGEALGGLHGANRLGGCAGAETYVFGALAGENAARHQWAENSSDKAMELADRLLAVHRPKGQEPFGQIKALREELQQSVARGLSIVRTDEGIRAAAGTAVKIANLAEHTVWSTPEELAEVIALKNMALTAQMIAAASEARKESRGVFFRSDYPCESPEFDKNLNCKLVNGEIVIK